MILGGIVQSYYTTFCFDLSSNTLGWNLSETTHVKYSSHNFIAKADGYYMRFRYNTVYDIVYLTANTTFSDGWSDTTQNAKCSGLIWIHS